MVALIASCERNAVYAECNQHPILGLMHYDFKHGTSLSPEFVPAPYAWADGGNGHAQHAWDKEYFEPTWRGGGYYYPTTSDYAFNYFRDWLGFIYNVDPMTGNVLVGFTRINPKDGLWEIYNRPWEKSHFAAHFN